MILISLFAALILDCQVKESKVEESVDPHIGIAFSSLNSGSFSGSTGCGLFCTKPAVPREIEGGKALQITLSPTSPFKNDYFEISLENGKTKLYNIKEKKTSYLKKGNWWVMFQSITAQWGNQITIEYQLNCVE
eukprot:NODE_640_length_5117_cov_0.610203.p3 type:complete len:134 gc:universal NODE_640_length_5117_cov_0.610203:1768-2169(+)